MSLQEMLASPQAWLSLATLAGLEIVLGVDNIVFISILAGKVRKEQRHLAMRLGILGALVTRLLLLFSITWVMRLSTPLFHLGDHPVSWRDLILVGGGLFLMGKAVFEIYEKVEAPGRDHAMEMGHKPAGLTSVVFQIMVMDIIFSLDSVITAVGMVDSFLIMAAAIFIAMMVILFFATAVGDFVERHPSVTILALSFLVLIGVLLVAEGTGRHLDRGYVYFAMVFSLAIQLLNMRYQSKLDAQLATAGTVPAEAAATEEE